MMSRKSKKFNTQLLTLYQGENEYEELKRNFWEEQSSKKSKSSVHWAIAPKKRRNIYQNENRNDDADYNPFFDLGKKEEFKKASSITCIKKQNPKKEMEYYQPEGYTFPKEEELQITHYFEQIENIIEQIQTRGERMEKKSQLFNEEMKTLQASIVNLEQQIEMELKKSE